MCACMCAYVSVCLGVLVYDLKKARGRAVIGKTLRYAFCKTKEQILWTRLWLNMLVGLFPRGPEEKRMPRLIS